MTTNRLRAQWLQRRNRNTPQTPTGNVRSVGIGSRSNYWQEIAKNGMDINEMPRPAWTPEAIAAAGGDMTPITREEAIRFNLIPAPYKLKGEHPDTRHKDIRRIIDICVSRGSTTAFYAGLVMEISTTSDRWYITFNEPDGQHEEQWFREASGGQGELFHARDYENFLRRIDIGTRMTKLEVRNGFRVLVFTDPEVSYVENY